MPFTFDFANGGGAVSAFSTGAVLSNTADGVTFTLSGDAAGGLEYLAFGNAQAPNFGAFISDVGSNDRITLTFQSALNPSNTRINGDAANPINIEWRSVARTWQVAFKTAGGGTSTPTGSEFVITNSEENGNLDFVGTGITGIVFTSTSVAGTAGLNIVSVSGNEFNC
ncbi:MAG: hypothetical protein AAF826_11360, partial [Pseudomonadota bacterium]